MTTKTKTAGVYDIYLSGSIYEVLELFDGAEYTISTVLSTRIC
jgi:hypothetical protein